MTKNLKITAEKKLIFFGSKTTIYISLGLHKERPSYKKSIQVSKEAIQYFKTWTFLNFLLLLWVIFALLDPDPGPLTRLNPDPIRIRIRNPVQHDAVTIRLDLIHTRLDLIHISARSHPQLG